MTCGHEACGLPLSRRDLLQGGTVVVGGGALLAASPQAASAAVGGTTSPRPYTPPTDYLAAAMSAADWILTTRQTDEFGAFFPPDPAAPGKKATWSPREAFYSGMAGPVLLFAELYRKTNEPRYREAAVAGAERLLAGWPALAAKKIEPIDTRWSLGFGIAGTAMVLHQVGELLAEPRYSAALGEIADRIVLEADPSNPQGTWTPFAGTIADASTVIFLVHAARLTKRDRYLQTARKAGDRLIALATQEPDGTLAWRGPQNPTLPHLYYPNFEMGTSGISFVLATLFEATHDGRYLEAAKRGASHLINLSVSTGNASLIPYALPDFKDIYYLGFCHGAAGTARLFYKLHQQTGDRLYLDWTDRLTQGILAAGAPELQSPGMWNTVTQCCGVASHVTLFLGLWASYGNPEHLDVARRAGKVILSRASNLDGKGNKWFMAWARIDPATVNAETGYMIGAAGIASALLHLQLAEEGRYDVYLPFDNPFPAKRLIA